MAVITAVARTCASLPLQASVTVAYKRAVLKGSPLQKSSFQLALLKPVASRRVSAVRLSASPVRAFQGTSNTAMKEFVITFCHNCDGGMQEYETAKQAIQDVFPDAEVKADRLESYPIEVSIKDASGNVLWTSDQRNLFRKYASRRDKSIEEIKEVLKSTCAAI